MGVDAWEARQPFRHSDEAEPSGFCWRELLDRAFTGWTPVDQALEHLIDRVEKNR